MKKPVYRKPGYTEVVEPWAELLELYEYKVADVLAGREPRGGRRSLVALRDTLLFGSLDSALMRRFRQSDRQWREYAVTVTVPVPAPAQPGHGRAALEDWSALRALQPDAESEALAQLGAQLWRLRLDDALSKLAARWRRESGLITLRVLYALSLNLEAGKLQHDVPDEHDPLVSLDHPPVALGVLGALVDQLLGRRSDTSTPVEWARSTLLELTDNPFPARRRSSNEVGHTVGGDTAGGRNSERTQIREALARGFEAVAGLLPPSLGGSGQELPALEGALFAHDPGRRLTEPDQASSTLALRLAGAGEVCWQGQVIAWQPAGNGWQLLAGGASYPLAREERGVSVARVPFEHVELRALLWGDYLLLDLEQGERASLPALLGLGRVVALLLDGADGYLNLRLTRGAAQYLRDGRFEAAGLGPDSAAKYAAADHASLLSFARKGAENLLAWRRRRPEADFTRALREVGRALGCSETRTARFLDALRVAAEARPPHEAHEVTGEDEAVSVAYQGEPVTVTIAGRALTLRADYRGEVTAVLPGAPALPVGELQVFALPIGGVIVARQGLRLLVGFQGAAER